MNDKIRELAIQAGAGEWGDSVVPAMMDIDKFAELIIKECAELVEDYVNEMSFYRADSQIKNHFGIE